MKKILLFCLFPFIISLCGCENTEKTETRFMLDTVVTLTADCNAETISGAFAMCENYERLLSRTVEGSDIYNLNNNPGFSSVSKETIEIIERAIYWGDVSGGKFDITVCPVSELWDFKNQVVPSKDEISAALRNVDYHSIAILNDLVDTGGKKIDLGGIAKGYIADKAATYLKENGAENGIVNLGGNVVVFGKKYTVGIKHPFEDGIIANIKLEDKACVTSGIYQRYIKSEGKIYHHIIDPDTGYGVENNLAGVTVIGNSSFDADALSTVCMLLGKHEGLKLINSIADTEAVFIDREGEITLSRGLSMRKNTIYFN